MIFISPPNTPQTEEIHCFQVLKKIEFVPCRGLEDILMFFLVFVTLFVLKTKVMLEDGRMFAQI